MACVGWLTVWSLKSTVLSNVMLDMPELFSECYLHLHSQFNVLKVTKFFSTLFS